MEQEQPVASPWQYGGQAVIEGVMMRSPRFFAVACRAPDGTIVVREEAIESTIIGKLGWLSKPFLRGTLALLDAMLLGMKALRYSADVQTPTVDGQKSRINDIAVGSTMVVSLAMSLGLFVALPTWITQLIQPHIGVKDVFHATLGQQMFLNFVDGLIKITIFLVYVGSIGYMQNIRRVFQFHGAEHKAINTLEAGGVLTPDICMGSSRIHPRCGTSFVIIVLIASVLVYSLFPRPPIYWHRLLLHIALIPAVAGLAYETIRFAGRNRGAKWLTWILAPGLWSQRLTTREPDIEHVEVALAALKAVINKEQAEAIPASAEACSVAPVPLSA